MSATEPTIWEDLKVTEQLFEDFKNKYLNLYDKVKNGHQKEKVAILDDSDRILQRIMDFAGTYRNGVTK